MVASQTMTLSGLAAYAQQAGKDISGADFTPLMKTYSVYLAGITKENFEGAHAPDGSPWPALRFPRPDGSSTPLRNHGLLMAGVVGSGSHHVQQIDRYSLTWGTNDERAALHQWGGTVVPKKGRALSIPLTREAQRLASPRDFPGKLFVYKSKGGLPFLAESKPARGKGNSRLILHFVLVPKVDVPARLFIGMNDAQSEKINLMAADFVARKL